MAGKYSTTYSFCKTNRHSDISSFFSQVSPRAPIVFTGVFILLPHKDHFSNLICFVSIRAELDYHLDCFFMQNVLCEANEACVSVLTELGNCRSVHFLHNAVTHCLLHSYPVFSRSVLKSLSMNQHLIVRSLTQFHNLLELISIYAFLFLLHLLPFSISKLLFPLSSFFIVKFPGSQV